MENNKSRTTARAPGRPRSIDRDLLLDAAEEIVTREGAGALTIDAVAKATGVTKGGVQYAFRTKDALVEAMFQRWNADYDDMTRAVAARHPGPVGAMRGHVEATLQSDNADHAKSAALMAALMRSPEELGPVRRWYRERLQPLDLTRADDRRARLAFLATEGAYMLRFFGLMQIDDAEWRDMLADIADLLAPPPDDGSSRATPS